MKTLVLYNDMWSNRPQFFLIDGDYSHLDGVYINSDSDKEKIKELTNILFTEGEGVKVNLFDKPTKDWDIFIQVGYIS